MDLPDGIFKISDVFSAPTKPKKYTYLHEQKKDYFRSKKSRFGQNKLNDFFILINNWPKLVGDLLAKNSIPLKIKGQTLYILTKHSVFSQEIALLGPRLVKTIHHSYPSYNKQFSKIKPLHGQMSSQDFFKETMSHKKSFNQKNVPKKPLIHPFDPKYLQIKEEIHQLLGPDSDEELQEQLVRLSFMYK